MPDYATGPGARHTHGPVIETYVDTDALDHDCPNCQAPAGEFCRHDTGQHRKMPCIARMETARKIQCQK